jgi:alkylation response protein AidB-like acyl-CoA dehydrogenase
MLDDERLEVLRMVRDSAGAIAPRGGSLDRVRALRFGNPGFDVAVWRQMAELGWIGLRLPAAKGGSALGMAESIALYEELGRGLVPEPLVAGTLAATMLAATGETALLAELLTGDAIVSLAWQGRRDGIDAEGDIATPRRYVPAGASALLLPVHGEGGLCLRLVNVEQADITLVAQQDGSAVATVRVSANAGRIVSGDIGELLARALDEAALGSAAYLLGVAERAFEITLDYLKQRKQFGQPLAAFQALQHRAADMKIQLTLTRASVQGAAADLDAGIPSRGRSAVTSRAKARAADTAMLVGREAIQMHGAIGYADECDIGLFTRKAIVVANQYGSAMAHRRRFADMAKEEPATVG